MTLNNVSEIAVAIAMIYAAIISTVAITVAVILPDFKSSWMNLLFKPTLVLLIIFTGNYFMKIFPVEDYLNRKFFRSLFKF